MKDGLISLPLDNLFSSLLVLSRFSLRQKSWFTQPVSTQEIKRNGMKDLCVTALPWKPYYWISRPMSSLEHKASEYTHALFCYWGSNVYCHVFYFCRIRWLLQKSSALLCSSVNIFTHLSGNLRPKICLVRQRRSGICVASFRSLLLVRQRHLVILKDSIWWR